MCVRIGNWPELKMETEEDEELWFKDGGLQQMLTSYIFYGNFKGVYVNKNSPLKFVPFDNPNSLFDPFPVLEGTVVDFDKKENQSRYILSGDFPLWCVFEENEASYTESFIPSKLHKETKTRVMKNKETDKTKNNLICKRVI